MRVRPPRVLVVYNEPVLPVTHPDAASEHDVVETSVGIEQLLRGAGFATARIGYARHPRALLRKINAA